MKAMPTAILIGTMSLLAACGTQPSERTGGGAAAGAATGAGIGALGGPPGAAIGALVGAGAGAATGAATSPNQVNLGKPIWDNPETRVPTPSGSVAPATGQRYGSSGRAASTADHSADQLNAQSLSDAQAGQSFTPSGAAR